MKTRTLTRDERMKLVMAPAGALGVLRHGGAAAPWAGMLMHWPNSGTGLPRTRITGEDEATYTSLREEDPDLDALD